jgi:hypothetical protein
MRWPLSRIASMIAAHDEARICGPSPAIGVSLASTNARAFVSDAG